MYDAHTVDSMHADYLTEQQINNKLNEKADKSDTYTKSQTYTQDQVKKLIKDLSTGEVTTNKNNITKLDGKTAGLSADGKSLNGMNSVETDALTVKGAISNGAGVTTTLADIKDSMDRTDMNKTWIGKLNAKTTNITHDATGTSVDGVTFNAGAVTGVTSINGTKIGVPESGEYISQDGSIWGNMKKVDTQVKTNADAIGNNTTAIAELGNKVGTVGTGTYLDPTKSVSENLGRLDAGLKQEVADRTAADTALSDRIGTVTDDGDYIKKSATNNVSENLKVLDGELAKTNDRTGGITRNADDTKTTIEGKVTVDKDGNVGGVKDLTVDGKLNVGEIYLENNKLEPTGKKHDSATSITADGISNLAKVTELGHTTESQFTHNEKGTFNYAKDGDSTDWTETRSDVTANGVTTEAKDSKGNRTNTSQTASEKKTYLEDKDGKNTNSTIDTAKGYDKTIKGENGETSTKQDELNITNTAEQGTIKNDAMNIENNATGDMTNNVGGKLTTNVTGQATENFNGGLDTNVTGKENHTVTGDQNIHVTGKQTNEIGGDQENTIGGNQTTTVEGNAKEDYKKDLTTTVGGNELHEVTGTKTENVTGMVKENYSNGQETNVTGNQDIYVSENQTNKIDGNQVNTIGGDQTTTVEGNAKEDYKKNLTTTVGGDELHEVTGNKTENVTGMVKENYSNGQETNVTGNQDIHVTGKQTNEIGGDQENTIGGDQTTTVEGNAKEDYKKDLTTTVGGDQTTNVTGDISNTAKNITNEATTKLTDKVGANTRVLDGEGITDTVGGSNLKSRVTQKKGSIETVVTDGTSFNHSRDIPVASTKTLTGYGKMNQLLDDLNSSTKTITDGTHKTSKVQTALDITNTAADGTITNDAKNIVNNASGDMTNTVGGKLTTTVTGATEENYNGGLTTNVTGEENHTVTGKQNNKVTGKQTNTVEGGQENIISGGQTNTITGGQINNITGDQTTTITGNKTETVTENVTEDYKKNLTTTVGGNEIHEVKGTKTETVEGKVIENFKGGQETNVTGNQDIHVTGKQTNKIDGDQVNTIGGNQTTNVTGDISNTAKNITNAATDTLTDKVGENTRVINSRSITDTVGRANRMIEDGKITDNAGDFTVTTDKENGTTFTNAGSTAASSFTTVDGTNTGSAQEWTNIKGNEISTGKVEASYVKMDYADVMNDLGVKGTTTTKTLKVTENATVGGTLDVTQKATFHDDVDIKKNLSVGGNATITGDVTAHSYKVGRNTYIDENGINANNQKITNVADGSISEGSKDAVNGGQLYGVKRDLEHQVDKVGANAAAMANLRPMEFDPSSKWNIAAAIGNYGSETAAAIGAFYRPNDNVMVNLSTAFGTGENMVGGGVSVRLGKGGNKLSREETNALKAQVADLTARMDALLSVLNPNMSKDFPDVPENHWAYEAVSRLAGNDIVQGYPDGEFHGERTMTRYEMAEIIYNALSRGAEAERKLVEEFKPELQAMAASEKSTAEKAEG